MDEKILNVRFEVYLRNKLRISYKINPHDKLLKKCIQRFYNELKNL